MLNPREAGNFQRINFGIVFDQLPATVTVTHRNWLIFFHYLNTNSVQPPHISTTDVITNIENKQQIHDIQGYVSRISFKLALMYVEAIHKDK